MYAGSVHNPFRFSAPFARPEELVGRGEDLERLRSLADAGTYVMLEAPRRFGKTSLVKATAHGWRETGGLAVWVDFSTVLTTPEAARRMEEAQRDAGQGGLQDLLAELLRLIRVRLGPVELGGLPGRAPVDPEAHLHELLEVPAEVARRSGRRSLVCLDEFQDVLAVPGLDGLLRSHLQHHADLVSYVFAGSEPSLLRELFSSRSRPLYAQAKPLRLGRIAPDALADHVAAELRRTGRRSAGGAGWIAELGAGHPQRTMLLAWHLWDVTPEGAAAGDEQALAAVRAALEDIRPELEAVWRSLAGNERRLAVALAAGLPPLGTEAQRATGMASRSAAQRALEGLLASSHAEREGKVVRLVDPLFAVWLREQHPMTV